METWAESLEIQVEELGVQAVREAEKAEAEKLEARHSHVQTDRQLKTLDPDGFSAESRKVALFFPA